MPPTTAPRRSSTRLQAALSIAVAAALALTAVPAQDVANATDELVSVIVRAVPGSADTAEDATERLGGDVVRDLQIINGFEAEVPASRIALLQADPAIEAVSPNAAVKLNIEGTDALLDGGALTMDDGTVLEAHPIDSPTITPIDIAAALPGSMANVAAAINADDLHAKGITGAGIDIAVLDSGVVPVDGLHGDKVVFGPDISFEGDQPDVAGLDTYGHGTHMAGIVAGKSADGSFKGIAPDARVVSVKVATATGATDVSQVIAGLQWIVEHKNANGMNIRVVNLSFGTDGDQDASVDPLSYAVEQVWRNGIVVVVSAGNSGDSLGRLNNPATNPTVIAVGAVDTKGTVDTGDDTVPAWSSVGNRGRTPDVAAPGRSIVSLRNPGSWIDSNHPEGRVDGATFKGSGTSQAAAVVSGAVALLLQHNPELTPGQVKGVLRATAEGGLPAATAGKGLIDVYDASKYKAYNRIKDQRLSATGTGTLDGARGSAIVEGPDGERLTGDVAWDGTTWTGTTWTGTTWTGTTWTGTTWTGGAWNGTTWTGTTWTGTTWTGTTWTGTTWTGTTWTGTTWTGTTWTGTTWTGTTWTGTTWTSVASWDGLTWE